MNTKLDKTDVNPPEFKYTYKEKRFIKCLLDDPAMNKTKACKNAGYKSKDFTSLGGAIYRKAHIKYAINKELERRQAEDEALSYQLREFWKAVVLTPVDEMFNQGPDGALVPKPFDELTEKAKLVINGVKAYFNADGSGSISFDMLDKMKASENLAKLQGLMGENAVRPQQPMNLQINFVGASNRVDVVDVNEKTPTDPPTPKKGRPVDLSRNPTSLNLSEIEDSPNTQKEVDE